MTSPAVRAPLLARAVRRPRLLLTIALLPVLVFGCSEPGAGPLPPAGPQPTGDAAAIDARATVVAAGLLEGTDGV